MKKYFLFIVIAILAFSCGKDEKPREVIKEFTINETRSIPEFSGERAYTLIQTQLDFGARNPNSEGHQKMLLYLKSTLDSLADEVILQSFDFKGYDNETLHLTNVIARFNPAAKKRIFFCAHWDTRPMADMETDPELKDIPIPGANDGGSGTAILLVLAEILQKHNPGFGVDLIFFDGEDYGKRYDNDMFCLGSQYFAVSEILNFNPSFGILLDLIGDREAAFKQEQYSLRYAQDIVKLVWSIAGKLGVNEFLNAQNGAINDDHVPLNRAGIRTINVIDSDLIGHGNADERRNYWHTHNDTMENISVETLQNVGTVMTSLIYWLEFSNE